MTAKGGFFGPRSVAVWTVIGGAAAVVALVMTFLGVTGSDSAGPTGAASSASTASATGVTSRETLSSDPQAQPSQVAQSSQVETVTGPGQPGVVYVEDFQPIADTEPYDARGVAQINGTSYTHSQGAQWCFGATGRQWEYDFARKYRWLEATIGLRDDSDSKTRVRYEVFADGTSVYTKDVSFGQSFPVRVPVTDVLRVRLVVTSLNGEGGCGGSTAEWGDLRASSTQATA